MNNGSSSAAAERRRAPQIFKSVEDGSNAPPGASNPQSTIQNLKSGILFSLLQLIAFRRELLYFCDIIIPQP